MKKKKTRRATRAFYAGLSYLSPRWNTKLLFLRKFGRLPDLKHPQTLNEKLLKQKLERFGTDPVVRRCADKYRVRDYVAGCGCGGTLNLSDHAVELGFSVDVACRVLLSNFPFRGSELVVAHVSFPSVYASQRARAM